MATGLSSNTGAYADAQIDNCGPEGILWRSDMPSQRLWRLRVVGNSIVGVALIQQAKGEPRDPRYG